MRHTVISALFSLLLCPRALAGDTWTSVREGVDWLHRTESGSVPQDIHAVRIDLAVDRIGIRASMDARGSERAVTTSTFARSVDALVAINGDWSDGSTPVGLAMGNGWKWHDHFDNPSIGSSWGYFACDVSNGCTIDSLAPLSEVWWFSPTISPYRYYNAVGTNGLLLLSDGARLSGCYDGCSGDTCRHPRSAVCLDATGTELWFIVVDGRRSGASGMTCSEVRDLAEDLGCWNAAMLDGGGSSTLWVDGAVRNDPSDGSERTVANHVGIVYASSLDSGCRYPGGAWCEGTRLRTCSGGQLVNDGDCASFGTTCQEDGQWAFCVDARCPGGDGMGATCLDATRIAACTDGVYGEGDCGAFGLACGTDAGGSACMDSRCAAGPHSAFCLDAATLAACTDGVYAERSCEEGTSCVDSGGGTAACRAPGETGDPGDPGDPDTGPPGATWDPPGTATPMDEAQSGGGCRSLPGARPVLALLAALLVVPARRRRATGAGPVTGGPLQPCWRDPPHPPRATIRARMGCMTTRRIRSTRSPHVR